MLDWLLESLVETVWCLLLLSVLKERFFSPNPYRVSVVMWLDGQRFFLSEKSQWRTVTTHRRWGQAECQGGQARWSSTDQQFVAGILCINVKVVTKHSQWGACLCPLSTSRQHPYHSCWTTQWTFRDLSLLCCSRSVLHCLFLSSFHGDQTSHYTFAKGRSRRVGCSGAEQRTRYLLVHCRGRYTLDIPFMTPHQLNVGHTAAKNAFPAYIDTGEGEN